MNLARAIVYKPKVILLDEPWTGLDDFIKEDLMRDLEHIVSELGAASIYVTHDQIDALLISDRVLVLDGRVGSDAATINHVEELPEPRPRTFETASRSDFVMARKRIRKFMGVAHE